MLTTDQKGALAEQAIAFEALALVLGVSRPLGDERYDLIFDLRPDAAARPVQVGRAPEAMSSSSVCRTRSPRPERGHLRGDTRRTRSMRIAAYCRRHGACYLLPHELSVRTGGSPAAAFAADAEQPGGEDQLGARFRARSYTVAVGRAHSSAGRASALAARRSPVRARLGPPEKPPSGGFFVLSPDHCC